MTKRNLEPDQWRKTEEWHLVSGRRRQLLNKPVRYEGYPGSNLRFGIKKTSERKPFLLYTFESHNLKLFFNTVAVQIEPLIITVHKLVNSVVIECCRLRLQPLIHACLQFRVVVEALRCEPGLHVVCCHVYQYFITHYYIVW